MKILDIIDSLKSGGKERRFVELLKDIKNRNGIICEIVILSNKIFYPEI